ncbi:hypothetical protein KAU11_01325 [Candidatus Babeliales bacterium]|nr:hypothetical protein [Candidatus Babeliales bacterium]
MQTKPTAAFTLIELLLTLSLFIFLATLTIPLPSFFTKALVKSEVEQLHTTFSFLQQKALATGAKQKLSFDISNNRYTYQLKSKLVTHTLPAKVSFDFLPNALGPPSKANRPITQASTFGAYITFFPDGTITPGTIYLVDNNKKIMNALTVPVSDVSYVRKYRYGDKRWVCF